MTPGRPTTPERLFTDRLTSDPGGPLVTFYDDATGERAELSARSMANWVAKTHFLLVDELGLGVGDRAYLWLPVHWLAVPILFGCWFAGLEVVSTPGDAAIAFGTAEVFDEVPPADFDEAFAVSLLSMARPGTPPTGAQDYALATRPMPDAWGQVRSLATGEAPALDGLTRFDLATRAVAAAAELGLTAGGRLLWARQWASSADWIGSMLAPLAVGGSTVLVANPDPAESPSRAVGERATVVSSA